MSTTGNFFRDPVEELLSIFEPKFVDDTQIERTDVYKWLYPFVSKHFYEDMPRRHFQEMALKIIADNLIDTDKASFLMDSDRIKVWVSDLSVESTIELFNHFIEGGNWKYVVVETHRSRDDNGNKMTPKQDEFLLNDESQEKISLDTVIRLISSSLADELEYHRLKLSLVVARIPEKEWINFFIDPPEIDDVNLQFVADIKRKALG